MIGDMVEAMGLFGQGPNDPIEIKKREAAEKQRITMLEDNIAWLQAEREKAAERWDFVTMEKCDKELSIAEKNLQKLSKE